jgi:hypothetical protein
LGLLKQFWPVASGKVGLSVLITMGILVVLGIFGSGRGGGGGGGGGETRVARPGLAGGGVVGDRVRGAGREVPASGVAYGHPLDPAPRVEWEVLTGCELIRTPTNAAHHFRVRRDGKPMVFALYFVEAPVPTEPGEEEIEAQVEYFGWPPEWITEEGADRSMALGQQAWQAVETLLESRPFMVLTKYELRRETHHFYALIVIEDEQGRRRTLQEWLVEQGLAKVTEPSPGWLPIRVSSERFVERLKGLERVAQRERRGAWGLVTAAAQGAVR